MSANAKSMNGINNIEINEVQFPDGSTISSANNLVQLDTNNNFTSFNTYNTNLPTSDVNPDLAAITNNTILNRRAADKLYIGNDEISECFNGASITGRDITLTRVDNANPEVIPIPETSLSTCVLLTGTQAISGRKTFNTFRPSSTLGTPVVPPNPTPPAPTDFITREDGDDLYLPLTNNGVAYLSSPNTFDVIPVGSITANTFIQRPLNTTTTAPTNDNQFITKRDGVGLFATSSDLDPCFKSAVINGQTLTLTPVSGAATEIAIPSGSVGSFVTTDTAQNISGQKTFTSSGTIFASITTQVGTGQGANGGGTISMPYVNALFNQQQVTARIKTNGRIGVGVTSPTFPIHVNGGFTGLGNSVNRTYLRSADGGGPYRTTLWANDIVGIYAEKIIMAGTYIGVSDVRIKRDIMDLSNTLPLIEQIKPRTYKYKDPKRGDKMAYGFIAQELEEVLPCVIKTSTDKIPNIMKTADVSNGVFTLKEATDLIEDDEIAIYDEQDTELKVKITEIINDKSFKVETDEELKDEYFIYGKYVDDFKAIEHNCLLSIMMKGIKELNAKVKELENKMGV